METLIFHSRKEKEIFLKEIIQKLRISQPEKDIYILCIEVLDDTAFESFFIKIQEQSSGIQSQNNRYEPLNLISL